MKQIVDDYFVTEDGKIWSNKTNKYISQRIGPKGYYLVNLSIKGKCKTYQVHRLVAKAFIANPNNYPVINHKDGDKLNNRVENLEWCTYQYNTQHACKNGLINPAVGVATLNGHFLETDIRNIRLLRDNGLSWSKIASIYNVTRSAIQQILNGSTYKWVH